MEFGIGKRRQTTVYVFLIIVIMLHTISTRTCEIHILAAFDHPENSYCNHSFHAHSHLLQKQQCSGIQTWKTQSKFWTYIEPYAGMCSACYPFSTEFTRRLSNTGRDARPFPWALYVLYWCLCFTENDFVKETPATARMVLSAKNIFCEPRPVPFHVMGRTLCVLDSGWQKERSSAL